VTARLAAQPCMRSGVAGAVARRGGSVWIATLLAAAMTVGVVSVVPAANAADGADLDCKGWLGNPASGSAAWNEADLNNQRCAAEGLRILQENPAVAQHGMAATEHVTRGRAGISYREGYTIKYSGRVERDALVVVEPPLVTIVLVATAIDDFAGRQQSCVDSENLGILELYAGVCALR